MPQIRDAILLLIGNKTVEELQDIQGKNQVKAELKARSTPSSKKQARSTIFTSPTLWCSDRRGTHPSSSLTAAIKSGKVSTELIENERSPQPPATALRVDLFRTYERARGSGGLRVPNLDIVLDSFARKFTTSLTNTLQRSFARGLGKSCRC